MVDKNTLAGPEEMEKEPYGPRLHEGWQLVMLKSVRLNEYNGTESVIIDVENEEGEEGIIWLGGSGRDRTKWLKLREAFGIDWQAGTSFSGMVELIKKKIIDSEFRECEILVGWGQNGKAYVNDIAPVDTHIKEDGSIVVEKVVDPEKPVEKAKTKM